MKVVVVGGVAGGMSAAARLRRLDEQADIVVLERDDYVSFANCGLPYHIGGDIVDRDALMLQTPESLRESLDLDVRTGHEVLSIDRETKQVTISNRHSFEEYAEGYDALVPPPARRRSVRRCPAWSITAFSRWNIPDMDAIIDVLDGGVASAVVVGGGYIGLEMVEACGTAASGDADPVLTGRGSSTGRWHDPGGHLAVSGVRVLLSTRAVGFSDADGSVLDLGTKQIRPTW
jgi:NADPH-dependent 2,4-dienoyl-CoA reductase/sulfur reductase-like enzyme